MSDDRDPGDEHREEWLVMAVGVWVEGVLEIVHADGRCERVPMPAPMCDDDDVRRCMEILGWSVTWC